jgi:hypothetical protein
MKTLQMLRNLTLTIALAAGALMAPTEARGDECWSQQGCLMCDDGYCISYVCNNGTGGQVCF